MSRISDYAGNRVNLRSKAINQVKSVGGVTGHLGALGEFLVTTWAGIITAIAILGIGGMLTALYVKSAGIEILVKNIVPTILIVVGLIIVALNALLTNPVQGSQLLVSLKYLKKKFQTLGHSVNNLSFSKERKTAKWWKFADERKTIVQTRYKRQYLYYSLYNVRGTVSPVTFQDDLEAAAEANNSLLQNNERDTILIKMVDVDKTKIARKKYPKNATEAMKQKIDLQYEVTRNIPHNQQIKTTILIAAPNILLLRERKNAVEAAFNRGLVVGYKQLAGNEIKAVYSSIFGEN